MFGAAVLVGVLAVVAGALAATTGEWSGVFGAVFYVCAFIALPLLAILTVAMQVARGLGASARSRRITAGQAHSTHRRTR